MYCQTVSIIILTRNRARFTSHCLDSLSATNYPVEWIIVDNGSNDETKHYLCEWSRNKSKVKFIWNSKDFGSCRARNQGLALASGELVLFLDNDVMQEDPGWLEELARPIRESQERAKNNSSKSAVVATAPLLLFPGPNSLVQCAGGGVTAGGRIGLIGRGTIDGPEWSQERIIAWAPTAALLINREVLIKLGGFDEGFDPVSVCEDIDLCCRLRAAGGQILFVGKSRMLHFEGVTFNHLGFDKRGYWRRHMRVIKKRWVDVLTTGTLNSDSDVLWKPVIKDYSDLTNPIVRLPGADEVDRSQADFFSPYLKVSEESLPYLRLAVIGCGQAAFRGALPGFSPPGSEQSRKAAPFLNFDGTDDVIISAVCDVDESKADKAATEFAVRRVENDDEQLLDDAPIEAVCICTPPPFHARQALGAIRREIAVLVEKPPVISESELEEMLVVKEEHGDLAVMVNLPWMFHPAVDAAKTFIGSGKLGTIRHVQALFENRGPQAWSPEAHWYREGGLRTLIQDLGLHVVFALEHLIGTQITFLNSTDASVEEERASARFLVGDVKALLSVRWNAPQPRFTINIDGSRAFLSINLIPWLDCDKPSAVEVMISEGSLPIEGLSSSPDGGLWLPHAAEPLLGGPYRHFVQCVNARKTPLTDISLIANSVRAVLHWSEAAEKW